MEQVLAMLKSDLGITSNARDVYFTNFIKARKAELEDKGITLTIELAGEVEAKIEDIMLLSDFSAWWYRNRTQNTPLSNNLQLRIRNRIVKARSVIPDVV